METKFNFKSAICTNRVQSERLLSLGLKKETADMRWERISEKYAYYPSAKIPYASSDIPAWSLHRLIEMMPENVTSDDWLGVSFDEVSYYHGAGEDMIGWKYYKVGNIYDCIIECYEWLIKEGYFKKEYLEE